MVVWKDRVYLLMLNRNLVFIPFLFELIVSFHNWVGKLIQVYRVTTSVTFNRIFIHTANISSLAFWSCVLWWFLGCHLQFIRVVTANALVAKSSNWPGCSNNLPLAFVVCIDRFCLIIVRIWSDMSTCWALAKSLAWIAPVIALRWSNTSRLHNLRTVKIAHV